MIDNSNTTAMVLKKDYYSKLRHDFHAGYWIYDNYKYLTKHNIGNYIKFQQWQRESSGKNPQLFYTFDDGVVYLILVLEKKFFLTIVIIKAIKMVSYISLL